jgi:4'-phosphopantetheinyl transferase
MGNGRFLVERWDFRLSKARGEEGLSREEIVRARGISDEARRIAYVRSRALLRRVLARRLQIGPAAVTIEITAAGKPRLGGGHPVGFSLSHSGDWLVVAVSEGEVGVDIETRLPRMDPLSMARRFFSAEDFRALESRPGDERAGGFRRQWVAKEAAVKAAGVGLADTLDRAECRGGDGIIREVRWGENRFSIAGFELADGTPGAVAAGGNAPIEIAEFSFADLR